MMQYQKIINFLENTSNQPFNFRTKNWVEIKIEFKTSMLKSRLCDYSYAYILVKRTTTVVGAVATESVVQAERINKKQYSKFVYLLLTV